jgi:hypothetical protein
MCHPFSRIGRLRTWALKTTRKEGGVLIRKKPGRKDEGEFSIFARISVRTANQKINRFAGRQLEKYPSWTSHKQSTRIFRMKTSIPLLLSLVTASNSWACLHAKVDPYKIKMGTQHVFLFHDEKHAHLVVNADVEAKDGNLPDELAWVLPFPKMPLKYEEVETSRNQALRGARKFAASIPGNQGHRRRQDLAPRKRAEGDQGSRKNGRRKLRDPAGGDPVAEFS